MIYAASNSVKSIKIKLAAQSTQLFYENFKNLDAKTVIIMTKIMLAKAVTKIVKLVMDPPELIVWHAK